MAFNRTKMYNLYYKAKFTYTYLSLDSSTPPTARAPGRMAPRGTARAVWRAMLTTLSSGTATITPAAAAAERAAPAKRLVGDCFSATPASGSRAGAASIPVATSGSTLSLEASKTPIKSRSSASTSRGTAVFSVNPDFSRRDNKPSCAVCQICMVDQR